MALCRHLIDCNVHVVRRLSDESAVSAIKLPLFTECGETWRPSGNGKKAIATLKRRVHFGRSPQSTCHWMDGSPFFLFNGSSM